MSERGLRARFTHTLVRASGEHRGGLCELGAAFHSQALAALLLLYREVLELPLPWMDGIHRAHGAEGCLRRGRGEWIRVPDTSIRG